MQDWDDLKIVLAVARGGSFARAAATLGLHETTIARRIAALSADIGCALFDRAGRGLRPTDAAANLIRAAETAESAVATAVEEISADRLTLSGTVTVTAVPYIANRILAPNLSALARSHPALGVHLIPSGSDLAIVAREADLALRFGISRAEADVSARKIATVRYAVFGRSPDQPWIAYGGRLSAHPPALWSRNEMRRERQDHACLIVEDAETAASAIEGGVGKGFLPVVKDWSPKRARRFSTPNREWTRPLWLLSHPDGRHLARVRAVARWLEDAVLAAL